MEKTDRHHSIKGCIRRRKPLWAGITLCLAIALTTLLSTCRNFGYISTKEEADTLRRFLAKGTACVEQRHADSALTYYSLVLSRYRPSMPDSLKRLCCKAANNMGYTYFSSGRTIHSPTNTTYAPLICRKKSATRFLPFMHISTSATCSPSMATNKKHSHATDALSTEHCAGATTQ